MQHSPFGKLNFSKISSVVLFFNLLAASVSSSGTQPMQTTRPGLAVKQQKKLLAVLLYDEV